MGSKSRHLSSYIGILVLPLLLLVVSCQSTKSISHRSFNLTVTEIKLGWEAPPVSDLAGYKVYYKTDSTAPPYDGAGLREGNSPIVIPLYKFKDPKYPEITLHGFTKNKAYFFLITAYNERGIESAFPEGIVIIPTTGD